ncbi:MAG TPA: Crp/Fnr family transcriptional regulator [Stellaceae bacterium]|jgi:CRP-like cAMP-binding protein|nr:Crp/Fnr family transcriptional regulator [Stellaceae bacterium]
MSQQIPYGGSNRILAALPKTVFEQFFLRLEPVGLTLRETLQDAANSIGYVYFIESGVTSILMIMANGATIEVGMVGPEGMIGVPGVLGGDLSAQQVIVQAPGTALRLPLPLCKKAFDESPAVRSVMLRFAGALLDLSAQTAACNRLHSIEQRCARWLLMALDRVQSETVPMTHEFLASMLGVRRAGVTTTAGELQRSGLITYRQREITIRDRTGLEAAACECYRLDHERLNRLL